MSLLMMSAMFDTSAMPLVDKEVYNELSKRNVKPVPAGMKLFNIDGVEVYALNEKNAIRKARQRSNGTIHE